MHELSAGWGLVERNLNLVRRYLSWEAVDFFYNVVNAVTIALIGVRTGPSMVLYLLVGALLWNFLSIIFNEVANSVQWERWEGTIEYTFMAPIRRLTYLLGVSGWAVLYATLRTALVLGVVALFFRVPLRAADLGAALVVLLVASASFVGIGLVAAILPLMSPERGAQATHIVQGALLLVSGVYYEVSALPAWLQPLSWLSPATYTLRAERAALLHGAGLVQLLPTLAILVAFALVTIPAGYAAFRAAERYALRTGRLHRNG
ncbi:MAG: ABC transporter permease [Bacillota bacterium]|nr:ABC transporter permease [Bacillota bacterium]